MPVELRLSFEHGLWIPDLYENLIKAMEPSSYTLNFQMFLEFPRFGGPKSLG